MPMTVSLPDDQQSFVERAIASGKYTSADDFFSSLIREAQRRAEVDQINAALTEGLECTGSIEVTPEYWAEKRRRLE